VAFRLALTEALSALASAIFLLRLTCVLLLFFLLIKIRLTINVDEAVNK
jgi:hypothetical protein